MKTQKTFRPTAFLSIMITLFVFANNATTSAQQFINQRSIEEKSKRGGYLYSETKYDRFSFMLTPSAIFQNAFQFDLSYRLDNSSNAFMISIANINSGFIDESNFNYNDIDDQHEGWTINFYHKYYLEQQEKGRTVYYFAHGLHYNYVEGNATYYNYNISPSGNFTRDQSYTFSRMGYNATFGFETLFNERFFFDLSIGLGARFMLDESISGGPNTLPDNVTRTFIGPAFTGLTPLIQTRFGLYIF